MGWLIACVLLALWLRARRRLKALTELALVNSDTEVDSDPEVRGLASYRQVYELSVLRLELSRLQSTEVITVTHYTELVDHIDAVLTTIVHQTWAEPQSRIWSKSRDAAWALLLLHRTALSPVPPWHDAVETERAEAQELASPGYLSDEISQPVPIPALSREAEAAILEPIALSEPVSDVDSTVSAPESVNGETPSSYALDPTPPSVVERVLQGVSGWPARLIPFMVQNIGWFIGGFCFVSGSVFLVSYTTGFAKALTIFTVLFAYTLLVLWAGYQLCRRRPELVTSSRVLLTIGVLLVPLNIAAAVRLMITGFPAAGAVVLGGLAAAVCVGGLYYTIVLVSGIVDRTLQGRHPQLFLALAAMQLTVPLLMLWPSWTVLALLHTVLLGLLICGFARFLPDWLHAIFIERRNTTYYAVGTLIYAAVVSFIHLTWGHQEPLNIPPGYYGPFLILLAGALFYVDYQLKQWCKRDVFLSRLSFAIYGLSTFALFAGTGTPIAQIMTLSLAIVLYAAVIWHYITLPPLYLLLACSAWLYHTILLAKVPFAGYFLASIPGLVVLYIGSLRALRFQSPIIAQMSFRLWVLAVLGLAGWSIGHAQPGPIAMSTSLMVVALAFFGPRYIPASLLDGLAYSRETLQDFTGQRQPTIWSYVGILAAVVAIAYAPRWTGLAWEIQLAIGWLGLAELWTLIGVYQLRTHRDNIQRLATLSAEVWFNGALLTIAVLLVAWVGFGDADLTSSRALPLLLACGGGILLQISWHLGCQWLFYGTLLCWGAAGLTVKLTYFPESGSGTTALSVALAVWGMLWWITRIPPDMMTLLRERAEARTQVASPPVLLGFWRASYRPYPDMVGRPLELAMLLLGTVGLLQAGKHLLLGELSWGVVASTSLGALFVLLVTGRFRWDGLLPLAIGLGLGSGLTTAYKLGVTTVGLSLVGTLYAIGSWRIGLWLLSNPLIARYCRFWRLRGRRDRLELAIYWSAFAITFLSLLIPLGQYGLFTPELALLCSLVVSMGFLWLSGQYYRHWSQAYLLLGMVAFSMILCYLWRFYVDGPPSLLVNRWSMLATDPGCGLTLLLAGLGMWVVARVIIYRSRTQPVERVDASRDSADHIYLTPLQVMAVALTLAVMGQQVGVAWLSSFGDTDTRQLFSIGVLGLASDTLLMANHGLGRPVLSLVGTLGAVFTLLWAQGLGVQGAATCAFGLLKSSCVDQWLTLACISGGMAYVAYYLKRDSDLEQLYGHPLCWVASVAYLWALLGAVVFWNPAAGSSTALLPWLLLALSVALIPIAHWLPHAAVVRGIGMGTLLTVSAISTLALGGWHTVDWYLSSGWAFALWGLGNFVLPRYNARWPHWSITSGSWPWFGLVLLSITFATWWAYWPDARWHHPLQLGSYLMIGALYLGLMLRNSRWVGMPWIAVLLMLSAGVAYNLAIVKIVPATLSFVILSVGLGNLVWLNLLLWGAAWWRRGGTAVATRLAWHNHDLAKPLLVWPLVGFIMVLLGLAILDGIALLWVKLATEIMPWFSIVTIGMALTLSCIYRLRLQRGVLAGHVTMASAFCALLATWLGLTIQVNVAVWGLHLPLFLALWCILLLGFEREWGARWLGIPGLDRTRQPVSWWLMIAPPTVLVALVVFPPVSLGELLLVLSVFSGVCAYIGWQRRQVVWLFVAMSAFVVELHMLWLFWVPLHEISRLAPGYALQLAGTMWLAGCVAGSGTWNAVERCMDSKYGSLS